MRTSILLVPSLKLHFFHMKCNQIQFSYHKDGSFCSILFIMFNVYQVCHAYLTPPSMRVTYYPIDPGSTQGSHRPTSFTSNNLLLWLTWWILLYRTLRKVTSTNMRKNMYVVTPSCAVVLLPFLLWCSDDRRTNTRTRTPWCIADCLVQVLRSRLITTNY